MRDYGKIAPQFWTDHLGQSWKFPKVMSNG